MWNDDTVQWKSFDVFIGDKLVAVFYDEYLAEDYRSYLTSRYQDVSYVPNIADGKIKQS